MTPASVRDSRRGAGTGNALLYALIVVSVPETKAKCFHLELLNNIKPDPLPAGHILTCSEAHFYFPFPQEQIDFSNRVLVLNPNY